MQKPIAVINQTTIDSLSDAHTMLLAVQLVASFLTAHTAAKDIFYIFIQSIIIIVSNFKYNIVGLGKYRS